MKAYLINITSVTKDNLILEIYYTKILEYLKICKKSNKEILIVCDSNIENVKSVYAKLGTFQQVFSLEELLETK